MLHLQTVKELLLSVSDVFHCVKNKQTKKQDDPKNPMMFLKNSPQRKSKVRSGSRFKVSRAGRVC